MNQIMQLTLTTPKNIYLLQCPLKMMKFAFYLILKALFGLKIYKFLS